MARIPTLKVLVIGDSRAGKSSFVHRLCHSQILAYPGETVGCNVEMKLHNGSHFIEFWDIGGHSKFEVSRRVFYSQANAIILLFDVTNRRSYLNLRAWIEEINQSNRADGRLEESFLHTASATLEALHRASQQQKKTTPRLLSQHLYTNSAGLHSSIRSTSQNAGFEDSDEGLDPLTTIWPSVQSLLTKPKLWVKRTMKFMGIDGQDSVSNRGDTTGILGVTGMYSGNRGVGNGDETHPLNKRTSDEKTQLEFQSENEFTSSLSDTSDTDIESGVNASTLVMEPGMLGGLPVLIVGNKVDLICQQAHAWNLDLPSVQDTTSGGGLGTSNATLGGRRNRATSEAPTPLSLVIPALQRKFRTRADFGYPSAFVTATKSSSEFDGLLDHVNAFLSAVITRRDSLKKAHEESRQLGTQTLGSGYPHPHGQMSQGTLSQPHQISSGVLASQTPVMGYGINGINATESGRISQMDATNFPISGPHSATSQVRHAQFNIPNSIAPMRSAIPPLSSLPLGTSMPQSYAGGMGQSGFHSQPLPPNLHYDSSHALAALEAESQRFSQSGSVMAAEADPIYRPGSLSAAFTPSQTVSHSSHALNQSNNADYVPTMSLSAFMENAQR